MKTHLEVVTESISNQTLVSLATLAARLSNETGQPYSIYLNPKRQPVVYSDLLAKRLGYQPLDIPL